MIMNWLNKEDLIRIVKVIIVCARSSRNERRRILRTIELSIFILQGVVKACPCFVLGFF